MPGISHDNTEILYKLRTEFYALPWYKKSFYPIAMRRALVNSNDNQLSLADEAFEACKALIHVRAYQRRLFMFLNEFSNSRLAQSFILFGSAGLFAGTDGALNFYAVVEHRNSWSVADALCTLYKAGLLNTEIGARNRSAVLKYRYSRALAVAFKTLYAVGLLEGIDGQANFLAMMDIEFIPFLVEVLVKIESLGLLEGRAAQVNFNSLAAYAKIIFGGRAEYVWHRDAIELLTSNDFHQIIDIAKEHATSPKEGQTAVVDYINTLLLGHQTRQLGGRSLFNTQQITHTESVHQSASQSAKKLMTRYGMNIQSEDQLIEQLSALSQWIRSQKPSLSFPRFFCFIPSKTITISAALRGFKRLINDEDEFIDPDSNVSIRQLLVLFWLAIHDDSQRRGLLEDAEGFLIEGLYEIQRGYNLSQSNHDNHTSKDYPICSPGAFNKLIEKLAGEIHPDVELTVISAAGASAKFPMVVKEEALTCLLKMPEEERALILSRIISDNCMDEHLWDLIAPFVAERLFEEFGRLFPGGPQCQAFLDFMDTGRDVTLGDDFETLLQQSIVNESTQKPPCNQDGLTQYSIV